MPSVSKASPTPDLQLTFTSSRHSGVVSGGLRAWYPQTELHFCHRYTGWPGRLGKGLAPDFQSPQDSPRELRNYYLEVGRDHRT